jgi:hypothetical protein
MLLEIFKLAGIQVGIYSTMARLGALMKRAVL